MLQSVAKQPRQALRFVDRVGGRQDDLRVCGHGRLHHSSMLLPFQQSTTMALMVFCCPERESHLVISHDSYEDRLFFGCFDERGAWSRAIYGYRSGEAGGDECVHS